MSAGLAGADVRGAPPGSGDLAVIVLHGRDQDPAWMYDHVVDGLAARLSGPAVTWVAPAAPGRAWYAGRVHDPLPDTRAERDAAADVVDGLAADLAAAGHAADSVVLAGFSQGACLVADHLLRRPRRWAGALIWTGAAFGPAGTPWPAVGERPLTGVPVLATNGDDDPWVPLSATDELVATLRAHGADVTTRVEPGRAHEVADGEIDRAAELLRRAAPG
ncbi:phospholipase/carboxylesterase [Actinomycetospora sp. NBRC 106375]|uniref:alpha/beta hydrolase n=1 Tax=Actinomycetospora sp. NBRC 106375 TaxID=3032207 RepID=UPI0024A046BD|nr:dienelactone hydrolase family protein [Actinomycetospora sp. NBRC 106375]GLZ48285.1 phospholipase/carboxylesterase [Actinomycetospora sp. NBRC 106375]